VMHTFLFRTHRAREIAGGQRANSPLDKFISR
jgi:hypothetical protein